MRHLLATTANIRLFTAVFTALAALSVPASAAVLDWNFQDHLGALPNTQTFTAGGLNLTARGFTSSDAGTALYGKNGGGDENGLGLANDTSGDHEITGGNFIEIHLTDILQFLTPDGFTFQMGSTTQNEGWRVYGTQDGDPFSLANLLASSTDPGGQEGFHSLAGNYDNYLFFYSGLGVNQCGSGCNANVLLRNFDATLAQTPLPGALGLFAAGLLGLGGLVRSLRKQCGVA
jgi:hypothetical protein